MNESIVDRQAVRSLARAAALPLEDERVDLVVELLRAWLPAANELSRAMSAADLRQTMPISVFTHPAPAITE